MAIGLLAPSVGRERVSGGQSARLFGMSAQARYDPGGLDQLNQESGRLLWGVAAAGVLLFLSQAARVRAAQ
jgi:hypothetical protein